MRGPARTKQSFLSGAIVLTLAVAGIGIGAVHEAAAQFVNPQNLIDMVKKKGSKETDKTKHLPKVFSGKKDATKTAVTPKNIPGHNFTGKNAIGRGTDAKGPTNAALSKGVDSKSASIGKGTDLKGTNGKSVLGKGIDSKGSNAALGKGIDPRGLNSKSGLGNSRIANAHFAA